MESIGEKLKAAREANGYTFDQAARDTHIAKRFLMALEAEDYSVFPGEPYLLGFLRNYAEFIGLDSHEILSLYKNIKLQEQPVPIDELLEKKKPVGLIAALAAAGLAVIAAGVYFGYPFAAERIAAARTAAAEKAALSQADERAAAQEFPMEAEPLEQPFNAGDVLVVRAGEAESRITIDFDGTNLLLAAPEGPVKLVVQEERALDLDGDGRADLTAAFLGTGTGKPGTGLSLRFERIAPQPASVAAGIPDLDPDVVGETKESSRIQEPVTILESDRPEPFSVDIKFRGYALFRYLADDKATEEKYYKNLDNFRIGVTNEIRLWLSNAGAANLQVAGKAVSLGNPGEVSTKLIRWVKNEGTGGYRLALIPVY